MRGALERLHVPSAVPVANFGGSAETVQVLEVAVEIFKNGSISVCHRRSSRNGECFEASITKGGSTTEVVVKAKG
jgi:hypothetical protein